jgi:hypothetical protein
VITPEDFEPEPSPAGLHCWRLRTDTPTTLFPDPVPVHVLLERSDSLYDADLSLLAEILDDIDGYLALALDYVRQQVTEDPSFFGLTEPKDGNLDEPDIGMVDTGWYVRFSQGDFPICDPYGLVVDFIGRTPTGVENLSEVEEIE